jgi:anti-anti-sigma factor
MRWKWTLARKIRIFVFMIFALFLVQQVCYVLPTFRARQFEHRQGENRAVVEVAYPLVENPSLKTLCIDLAAVSFLDSSSLGILLLLREKVSAKGMNMTLRNPNPTVLPALKMVRFDKLFETSNR